jgi:hypothetical protein
MTSKTARTLGNVLLAIALVLLAADLAAMLGKFPRFHDTRALWMFAFVLLVGARLLRRHARSAARDVGSSHALDS